MSLKEMLEAELSGDLEEDSQFLGCLLIRRLKEINRFITIDISTENYRMAREFMKETFCIADLLKKVTDDTYRSNYAHLIYSRLIEMDAGLTRIYTTRLSKN